MAKPIIAIMYDFDKTLSTEDMQNYALIPSLGLTPDEFWEETGKFGKKSGVERVLSYMYMIIKIAKEKGIKLDRKFFADCASKIKYYPGVTTWFKRINEYGASKGVEVEHYLVSSGTKEIIEGCSIYNEFKEVYGCEYYYENDEPVWPKLAINYTQKTQFFFRVAKGAIDVKDDDKVNEKSKGLRVKYRNIVYLGDGMTDIAAMTLVKHNEGKAIAIYQENDAEKAKAIYEDGRCNFVCKADYSAGSDIEKVMKLMIDLAATREELEKKEKKLFDKTESQQ